MELLLMDSHSESGMTRDKKGTGYTGEEMESGQILKCKIID